MISVCSYCQKYLRGKADPDGLLSHGICPECAKWVKEQFVGISVEKYLTKFELPIVIVNEEGRVLIANEHAKHMVGKDENSYGFLGGEFMECKWARLPEGCGKTEHCSSCTIRNTVQRAVGGMDSMNVPAFLNQDNVIIHMRISTQKIEDKFIVLTINEVTSVEQL